jgi:hypothetical protein
VIEKKKIKEMEEKKFGRKPEMDLSCMEQRGNATKLLLNF